MSGSKTLLSRPRTRVYDANYNLGEAYYRPAIDRLDRKYSGRPLEPSPTPTQRGSSLPRDVFDRAFDEDLNASRRRAEKLITEENLFDSRGARIDLASSSISSSAHREFINDETATALKAIRANKKISTAVDDVDLETTVTNLNSRRLLDRSDKLLRSIGLDEGARRALDDDITFKRLRSQRGVSFQEESGVEDAILSRASQNLTKWSQIVDGEDLAPSAAAIRARRSKDRLFDLENEIAEAAEKQAVRERRAARFRSLVNENIADNVVDEVERKVTLKSRRKIIED